MQRVGVARIWVHVRDPRQMAVSGYFHRLGEGQGSGPLAAERVREEQQMMADRQRLGLESMEVTFDAQVRELFVLGQQWIKDWLLAEQRNPWLRILFTTFEQLVADRPAFEQTVCNFFGFVPVTPVFVGKDDADRFRIGSVDEWREVCGGELRQWLQKRIDREIFVRFGWAV